MLLDCPRTGTGQPGAVPSRKRAIYVPRGPVAKAQRADTAESEMSILHSFTSLSSSLPSQIFCPRQGQGIESKSHTLAARICNQGKATTEESSNGRRAWLLAGANELMRVPNELLLPNQGHKISRGLIHSLLAIGDENPDRILLSLHDNL